jgi:hypothetical protein
MGKRDVHNGGIQHHHQLGRGNDHKGQAEVTMGLSVASSLAGRDRLATWLR